MKLTINRITLLFGLIVFADFFFFDGPPLNIFYIPIIFTMGFILGILNRQPSKPYAYWRGLLIGIRILLFGGVFGILLFTIAIFIYSSPEGIINAIRESIQTVLMVLPRILAALIFSVVPILIIPLFFLRKSNQTDDIIDADLMDNGQE